MIRNQSIFTIDNKKPREMIRNPEFMNPFQHCPIQVSHQSRSIDKSTFSNSKLPFEPSSNKKSNKIKQAKQLLAQRLKEVTNFQLEESEISQNTNFRNQVNQNQRDQGKNWDFHMNPISKLTKQPFVRSKTCEQLRKQHSLKKQRKRNNSATKYNSPQTNQCEREIRSTGLFSKEVQSGWIQPSEYNRSEPKSTRVQTKQFEVDPFGNNMIETFDDEQIKKLSSDVTKKRFKGKYVSGKKASVEQREEQSVISEIKYPFRINSAFHQESHGSKSPNKFENCLNQSSNLLINDFNQLGPTKFTPKLERYPAMGMRQNQVASPPQNVNFQRIQIRKHQNEMANHIKEQDAQKQKPNEDNSYEYSDDQKQEEYQFNSHQSHPGMRSGVRSSYNQNQLVANLHFTNTILQEKLRIKEIQIEELNHNYSKLKTQLLQSKNISNQNIRYPPNHNLKIQTTSLTHEKYLTNIQTQNNPLEMQQITHSEFINESNQASQEISSLPSPKFCDGVEEQFARERYIPPQRLNRPAVYQQSHAIFIQPTNFHSKFAKKRQLFSSDMSQKISEEFDSEEIFMPTHHDPQHSYVSRKYVFKKSHFNDNNSSNFEEEHPKRDSYVYTLGEEQEQNRSSQKNIDIQGNANQRPVSGNSLAEEMLLEPITQSINSSDKIDLLSPIKSHSTEKAENSSFRHSFRTSLSKSQNRMFDESMRKFDYYLTPQKDENTFNIQQEKEDKEGLFEKAFSSLKKKRDSVESSDRKANKSFSQSQHNESHRYSSSSSKKQQPIDPIIQHAIE